MVFRLTHIHCPPQAAGCSSNVSGACQLPRCAHAALHSCLPSIHLQLWCTMSHHGLVTIVRGTAAFQQLYRR